MRAVFGIDFSLLTQEQLVKRVTSEPVPEGESVRLVATANLDHVVNLSRNERFRRAYAEAWVTTADGAPVFLYAKLMGCGLPERVTGVDLFEALMLNLSPDRHRPFFVVSKSATGDYLREWLLERGFSSEQIGVLCPPFGFERDESYSQLMAGQIRHHKTTHLVFGVGAPKSEVWINTHKSSLGSCYAFGFGAGLDFFSGTLRRAPRWMRQTGLEWLWRVGSEPKRLSRRYFVDSWRFLLAIKRDLRPSEPGRKRGISAC